MGKRYIITRRNGSLEDIGAENIQFIQNHVAFLDEDGEPIIAYHSDEIRMIEFQTEED